MNDCIKSLRYDRIRRRGLSICNLKQPVNKGSGLQDPLGQIKTRLREFVAERDWDQFHSPKNLAMALIVEAAELVEHFQWLKEEESAALPPNKLGKFSRNWQIFRFI